MIHPSAIISESSVIGNSVSIGPYSIIGENVKIGDGCSIESHVVIKKNTSIGKNNKFYQSYFSNYYIQSVRLLQKN